MRKRVQGKEYRVQSQCLGVAACVKIVELLGTGLVQAVGNCRGYAQVVFATNRSWKTVDFVRTFFAPSPQVSPHFFLGINGGGTWVFRTFHITNNECYKGE